MKPRSRPPLPARQKLEDLLPERLSDDPARVRVALTQRPYQRLRLGDRDVGRQRRHVRVDDRVDREWAVGGERRIPGTRDVVGRLDADAVQADQLREVRA